MMRGVPAVALSGLAVWASLQAGCAKMPTDIGQRNNPLDPGGTVCQYYTVLGGANTDSLANLAPLPDGGCVAVGSTRSYGAGNNDIMVVRATAAGSIAWTRTFGTGDNDQGRCVQLIADGGYYVLGQSTGSHVRSVLVRTDADGAAQWMRYYSDSMVMFPYWMAVARDGGALVCGYGAALGVFINRGMILRYDASGNLLWTRTTGQNAISGIDTLSDGGFIVSEYSQLSKYDSQGQHQWDLAVGANTLHVFAAGGGFAAYGSYQVSRYDAGGSIAWSRSASDYGVKSINSVRLDQDGAFILCGVGALSNNDPVLCAVAGDGSLSRSLTVTGAGAARDAARGATGGCLLGGNVAGTGGVDDMFLYLTKPHMP